MISVILKAVWVLITTAFALVMLLYGATFWAIGKSIERQHCYRTAHAITDCAQPEGAEQMIRDLTDWIEATIG